VKIPVVHFAFYERREFTTLAAMALTYKNRLPAIRDMKEQQKFGVCQSIGPDAFGALISNP